MTVTGLSKRQRAGSRRGAAMVEMALIIPILVALVFGMIEIGLMIKDSHAINQLAREVARDYSIGRSPSLDEIKTMATQNFGLDGTKVGGTLPPTPIEYQTEFTVNLTYNHTFIAWGSGTKTLSASIIMLRE